LNPDDALTRDADGRGSGSGLSAGQIDQLRIRIPGYQLLEVIGRGGQATVFKAIKLADTNAADSGESRTVAIKLLNSGPYAGGPARERMRREVLAMKALIGAPNIVCVSDSGQTEDGQDYLVMNYIEGNTLDEFWKHHPATSALPDDSSTLLLLFKKICDAVGSAHMRGITHRDLSPSNIIVDPCGEPHILDFGLAKTAFDGLFPSDEKNVSITGQFIGKLAYASPEQAKGTQNGIDIRTDVYALGVILYQIVTGGRFPYEVVGNLVDVLNNIIHLTPTPPSKILDAHKTTIAHNQRRIKSKHPAAVNEVIEAIVLKALEKDPANRYQSAVELARDIESYMAGQPTLARVAGSTAFKKPANHRTVVRMGMVAALSLGVVALIAVIAYKKWTHPLMPARTDNVASVAATPVTPTADPQWKDLFNGKDTSGWNDSASLWKVDNGVLIGSGGHGFLTTQRTDFANFRLRVEAMINDRGDSGVQFRMSPGRTDRGYEAQIEANGQVPFKTGSLVTFNGNSIRKMMTVEESPAPANQWFTMEVVADGFHITTSINGKLIAETEDLDRFASQGAIGLQVWTPQTVVKFRKIQFQELQPGRSVSAPTDTRGVDLLPLIDLKRDALASAWERRPTGLACFPAGKFSLLRTPYVPPAEYDIHLEFSFLYEPDKLLDIAAIGPHGDQRFNAEAGWNPGRSRLNINNWQDDSRIFTDVESDLFTNKRHRMVVQVRAKSITTLLDDQMRARTGTEGAYKGPPPWWMWTGLERTLGLYARGPDILFNRIEVVEVTGKGQIIPIAPQHVIPTLPKLPPNDTVSRLVDLMPFIDPKQKSTRGFWMRHGSTLTSGVNQMSVIQINYEPPQEYNLHLVFTRNEGREITQILPLANRNFCFSIGDWTNASCSFPLHDDKLEGSDRAMTARSPNILVDGQKYSVVIYVRKGMVAASIDGKLVIEYPTDYSNLEAPGIWRAPDGKMGLGTDFCETTFHTIEIAEITGQGKPSGEAQPAK
jgi:serine/threonine protein kinase